MLEKSKEIKFGKPGRSKMKKGATKGRRRRKTGSPLIPAGSPKPGEKGYQGNITPREYADYLKRVDSPTGDEGARGYMGEDRDPDAVRYDETDVDSTLPNSMNEDGSMNQDGNLSERVKEIREDQKKIQEAKDKASQETKDAELVDRRGPSREEKQNTPQGANPDVKVVKEKEAESKKTTDAKKSNPYADAKKKDPKLDSYIKIRNNSKKGSAAYNAAQNKINSAYGKGPQRKVDITPVKAKKAEPIERKSTSDRIITISSDKPIKTASKPTPKSGSASSNKNNTGGGSGMGGVQSEKNKLKNLGITTESDTKLPPSLSNQQKRQNKRAGKRAERDENKAERKDRRNKIREIKGKPAKASYGMSKEYKKGGRKRAFVGAATGAITGALGSIGSGEGVKGMLKGAATGAVNSVVPGLGTAVGAGIGGKTPAVPAAPPAAGAGANAPVDPAVPAPVTPPVDPNATVTARKGKMKDRRKQAKKGARRKYV